MLWKMTGLQERWGSDRQPQGKRCLDGKEESLPSSAGLLASTLWEVESAACYFFNSILYLLLSQAKLFFFEKPLRWCTIKAE